MYTREVFAWFYQLVLVVVVSDYSIPNDLGPVGQTWSGGIGAIPRAREKYI